jgi:NitT/TauT family transport system permease protein
MSVMVRSGRKPEPARRPLRRLVMVLVVVALVVVVWELTKTLVPIDGVSIGGTRILPRTDNGSLPSIGSVLRVLGTPEVDIPGSASTGSTILSAALFSLRLAALGFALGLVVGIVIGTLAFLSKTFEHAVMPYVVLAPTVPILAIAPLVATWSGKIAVFGHPWQSWMSVSLITSYLVFFPVAIGVLRGLSAPTLAARELFHCMAAPRGFQLVRLNVPSSIPYVIPALKIGAASAVVGAIVSEISTGTSGGIGRLIMDYVPQAAADGSRLFAAVIAAALLGMLATAIVSILDFVLRRYQGDNR